MKYLLECLNPGDKPIRMNSPLYLREAWPVNRLRKPEVWSARSFDSLESVLSSLDSYISACSAMRADVLATLFLTRRFHVVYSPCMGNSTQPAATHYMNKYGSLMASITLEVDFTKLAGSWRPEAVHLDGLRGLDGVKRLVDTFVQSQLTRSSNTPIRDLRVLVRRYHGFRPQTLPAPPSPPPSFSFSSFSSPSSNFSSPSTSPVSTTRSRIASAIRSRLRRRRSTNALASAPSTPPPTPTPTPTTTRWEEYSPAAHVRHALSALPSLGPVVSRLSLSGAPADFSAELAAEWPRRAARAPSGGGKGEGASSPPVLRVDGVVRLGWGGVMRRGGTRGRRRRRV
ncbi:hypothetical protein MYCTH_2315869 [Thermothelomyces thermophilus ATCC 42464]|uniref:Uncharacterized protein n=1 Tax=Thermothelomyces thermophilus (strain ATCC 42464 / BCRC 31852 / DSM 1799) TaxID=573729 RepID=G2QJS0_THET4|nr:uncharacterized protein MYCTH_2315869 [Thermothelomyces thermophilus ATCC 42464]AEO59826.1 hypothetical protein MYCTH_2315869 [Thermothelomyces thermophilus ATCC 42464]